MTSSIPLASILLDLLIPPACLAWLALLALLLPARILPRRLGPRRLCALFLVPLVALSLPYVSGWLIYSLRPPLESLAPGDPPPGAIVILSAEAERVEGPERLEVGPLTLQRERAGAALARATGLPVLVTGGLVDGPPAIGMLMALSMARDFGVRVRWTEFRSGTTWENARFSAPILKAAGITKVYVVTHAWHMRRSLYSFRQAGLEAVAAPTRLDLAPTLEWGAFLPRSSAWQRSFYAFHEWIGLLYYRLRA